MSLITNDARLIYRIDDLLVDVATARVSRGNEQLALPRLSFDLLLALIERAPAIVSQDQLMSAVWPGLVVSPETISQRIKLLRAALGDDSKEPRYVSSTRGRGYRLVPPVERVSSDPDVPSSVADAVQPAKARRVPIWVWGTGGVVVLAVLVALLSPSRHRTAAVVSGTAPSQPRSVAVLAFESLDATPRGKVMALGISEAVLHQLASVNELSVIARTSSFAFAGHNEDVRAIGAKLSARYLLEGSVQAEDERLRVTAQLIDAVTGDHMWSMRFDRTSRDVFAVQDEIALEVTQALKLSLDTSATDRMLGRRTTSMDAYFAYLQGRALAVTLRIAELKSAAAQFALAIKVDPKFAPAYVELASARMYVAEFEITADRQRRFDAERADSERLIATALELDPDSGEAYAARAHLRAFTNLNSAEADYRKSIVLSPSYAPAYEGLAAVLYQTITKRDEALAMLERARQLDPLVSRYDVTKSIFLLYWRGQVDEAAALLREVLERDPLYQPALMRYGETLSCMQGKHAEGLKYLEQAIELDPQSDFALSGLIHGYLDVDQPQAVADLIATHAGGERSRGFQLQLFRHQWRAAGESVYAGYADGTLSPYDEGAAAIALRMHARVTRQFARAREVLEKKSGVTWDPAGVPKVPMQSGIASATVALGDVLIAAGEIERGQRLLRTSLADMDRVMREFARSDVWYRQDRAVALALLGEDEAALKQIKHAIDSNYGRCRWWSFMEIDPAFVKLRDRPEFRDMLARVRAHARAEEASLNKMRGEGLVPRRP